MGGLQMDSSGTYKKESAKATGGDGLTLRNMNELYSLELSQALAQAVVAGIVVVEVDGNSWAFPSLRLCIEHQMLLAPSCPFCGQL
jgi:hypothetical protein